MLITYKLRASNKPETAQLPSLSMSCAFWPLISTISACCSASAYLAEGEGGFPDKPAPLNRREGATR